ncbi:ATP-dependent transcriptional regulator [Tsukamurella ocularis]
MLLAAAFGADCGPVGPADGPQGRAWLRAVALAGAGRFAAARSLTAGVADGPFASAARCLEASMLRQSGRHRAAAVPDGAALAAAVGTDGQPAYGLVVASTIDATVGLAADALGTGRYALSARLLARADEHLAAYDAEAAARAGGASAPPVPPPWWTVPRARLRRDWVAAEFAVYSGDAEGTGVAVEALLTADPGPGRPRHHAKTLLIAGAAAMASGEAGRARELVERAYQVATESALNPLRWAGAKMMSGTSGQERGAAAARIAAVLEEEWIRDGADLAGV